MYKRKKDLEFCSAELSRYQNLSRTGLTLDEMRTIDGIMIKLRDRIANLRRFFTCNGMIRSDGIKMGGLTFRDKIIGPN